MTPARKAHLATKALVVDHPETDWIRGLLMVLAAVLALGWIDANDRRVDAEEARARAEAMAANLGATLAEERAIKGLPNPAIVLDARTAREFGLRLAEIAGGVDGVRAELSAPQK